MAETRPQPDDTPPGTLVAGRFRIVAELGRGGMARVHRALDGQTGREVALKLLKPEIAENAEAMERFRREAEFLAGLNHPAIVGVAAFGKLEDGRLYLAMELLEGETLGARMRRGKLAPAQISPILAGAAVGLDAAHRAGVVHRDLKPDNVFLVQQPGSDTLQVKLLDFGISKVDGRQSLTQTGQILGTPRYMAPEQLAGDRDIDGRADVYALGVIVYEALAGQPAFPSAHPADLIVAIIHGRATPLRAVRPDVSAELEAVVGRAMARARDARYGSATELAQAWFEVVHGEPTFAGVRTGAGTRLMGAMDASSIATEQADRAPEQGAPFRPATFREFEVKPPEPKSRGQSTVQLSEFSPAELSKSAAEMSAVAPPAARPAEPSPAARQVAASLEAPRPVAVAQAPTSTPKDVVSGYERTIRPGAQVVHAMPMVTPVAAAAASAPTPSAEAASSRTPRSAGAPQPQPSSTPLHATPLDEPSIALPTRKVPWIPILVVGLILGLCVVVGVGVRALYLARGAASETTAPAPVPQPIAPPPASAAQPSGPAPTSVSPDATASAAQAAPDAALPPTPPSPTEVDPAQRPEPSVDATIAPQRATPETATRQAPDTAMRQAPDARPQPARTPIPTPTQGGDTATPPPWSGGGEDASQATAAQLVQRAKDAMRAGDARACVSLATEALAQGADATTYALRGDCYRMLGDNARALRSYQRFCQLAPSHPRVTSVRATAESLGGTCP